MGSYSMISYNNQDAFGHNDQKARLKVARATATYLFFILPHI